MISQRHPAPVCSGVSVRTNGSDESAPAATHTAVRSISRRAKIAGTRMATLRNGCVVAAGRGRSDSGGLRSYATTTAASTLSVHVLAKARLRLAHPAPPATVKPTTRPRAKSRPRLLAFIGRDIALPPCNEDAPVLAEEADHGRSASSCRTCIKRWTEAWASPRWRPRDARPKRQVVATLACGICARRLARCSG